MTHTLTALAPRVTDSEAQTLRSPYLFVVGCPRSGTTLLQRMLDNHPMLAVTNDTHFIPKALPRSRDVDDPVLTSAMVTRVLEYRRFPRLGLDEHAVRNCAQVATTYGEFVAELYRAVAVRAGKAIAGEKTPDYVRKVPLLADLFPWARFVHIVRDGRDVALSAREWAHQSKGPGRFAVWKTSPIGVSALWWTRQVRAGRIAGRALSAERYLEVRYEALVAAPERIMRQVADFLRLPYSSQMTAFHQGREIDEPGLSAKRAWRPATPGLRNWRDELHEDEIELFECLAGDELAAQGYDLEHDSYRAQTETLARRIRAGWMEELARRRRSK